MNREDHIRAARQFLAAADILIDAGMNRMAGECVWGAAVQVIDTLYLRHPPRHPQNRDRAATVSLLGEKYQRVDELQRGFVVVRNNLHNHFYTGRLSESELSKALEAGRTFVNMMLELAELEFAEDDFLGESTT